MTANRKSSGSSRSKKNVPIDYHQITVGTLRNSLVHPREVFRPAIRDAANCILVDHNHPSGDPTPGDQNISVTERLEQTSEVIGIPVIDHIIVAGDKALSIQEWQSGNRWEWSIVLECPVKRSSRIAS